jgi:hypothetical protein
MFYEKNMLKSVINICKLCPYMGAHHDDGGLSCNGLLYLPIGMVYSVELGLIFY